MWLIGVSKVKNVWYVRNVTVIQSIHVWGSHSIELFKINGQLKKDSEFICSLYSNLKYYVYTYVDILIDIELHYIGM